MANRFRTSFTSREGLDTAHIVQGRIINTNLVNWTVDVRSQFDRHLYNDIQVSSPYQNFVNGEGIYCFPEIGADCMVAMPSDSSPPFVLSFIMPHEVIDTSAEDAPQGTTSRGAPGNLPNTASFAGGRPRAKPGDICLRGRDGNFVTLHRGGVLQIGANELSQRIFIPVGNIMTDISGQYIHHNTMGSVTWGLQEGPTKEKIPGMYTQTFRVHADDQYADVRIRAGKVVALSEPQNGAQSDLSELSIGTTKDAPIVYEVALAQGGFTEDGSLASSATTGAVKLRYLFDRAGGTFLRAEGNVLLACRRRLKVRVAEAFSIEGEDTGLISFKKGLDIRGGAYVNITGDMIRVNGGTKPVARAGDIVQVILPFTPMAAAAVPLPLTGLILSGSANFQAP